MHIRSLKHVVEAVNALVHPTSVVIMGSSSVLVYDPTLGETSEALELSLDADLVVEPMDDAQAAVIHEAIGEGSLFQQEYGVYADLLRPEIGETLPPGWRERCRRVEGFEHVVAVEPHDLAVAKLTVGREKDMALIRELLVRGLVEPETLRQRYQSTLMDEAMMFRAGRAMASLLELDR